MPMLDRRIKLRHLLTFAEVAQQRGIGRAATTLRTSQPAVTRTIRELDDILAVPLFDKDGRGIRLSPAGETFLKHALAALATLRQGVESVAGRRDPAQPPLRIGALPTVSTRIMPAAIDRVLGAGPFVPIKIVTGENEVLLEQLRKGQLDLVVGRLAAPEQMAGLAFEYLYSETVRFVVRPGHPLLGLPRFDITGLALYTVLMPTRTSVIRPFVERFLIARGLSGLSGEIETVSDAFGRAFVARTDAVWIISEGVISNDLARGTLVALPIDTAETRGAVGSTVRAGETIPPALETLLRSLRETVAELVPAGAPG